MGPTMADLVAALPDPVVILDGNGMVQVANHHAASLLEAEPVGRHISMTIRAPAVLEAVKRALATRQSVRVEYEVRGTFTRHFEVYLSPLGESGTATAAVLLLIKDLTREQHIERMRSDFVANASHELRTPLASLSGFVETLLGAARNDDAAREKFLVLMRGQAERMRRLIDDLLSLSRIEMNEHMRPSGRADLAQVARHVNDTLAMVASTAGITLKIAIDGPLLVEGDWDELVQVVLNLVENAIKYSPAGTFVEITGAAQGGQAVLHVQDQGPGIAEEHIPRLTERFYRINVQESRSRGGTGLGLAIVKHILNRHRGRLVVHSKLGQGSRFSLHIPLIH
jgi:two-component system phosphate regulon sensor histidine kinase PhoR